MNLKFFKLSALLGVLLLPSAFPALAMDKEEVSQFSTLPKFPLKMDGEDIDNHDYVISGKSLKKLLALPCASFGYNGTLTDEWTVTSFGVYAVGLQDYNTISDYASFVAKYSTALHYPGNVEPPYEGWKIEGFYRDGKAFNLFINKEDY